MIDVGRMTVARPKAAAGNHLHHEEHEENVKHEESALRRLA